MLDFALFSLLLLSILSSNCLATLGGSFLLMIDKSTYRTSLFR
jgi:hypothetical protein